MWRGTWRLGVAMEWSTGKEKGAGGQGVGRDVEAAGVVVGVPRPAAVGVGGVCQPAVPQLLLLPVLLLGGGPVWRPHTLVRQRGATWGPRTLPLPVSLKNSDNDDDTAGPCPSPQLSQKRACN